MYLVASVVRPPQVCLLNEVAQVGPRRVGFHQDRPGRTLLVSFTMTSPDETGIDDTTPRQAHSAALRPLDVVVNAVPASRWNDPSPCEGWTAGDVLNHLVSTQRDFFREHGADPGSAPELAPDPAAAWRGHAVRIGELLADHALVGRVFDGFFGPTTVGDAFVQFYVWDMVVHRWDLACATGVEAAFTDAELDQVERGADGFGPVLHMDGICAPALDASTDDARATRVLARLGRRA